MKKKLNGFTLVELLVVVAILVILGSIVASNLKSSGGAVGGKVPALRGPVNDYADVLSDAQEKQIEAKLLAQEQETSNQIVILTVKSLGGRDPQQYATEVFNTWKLGQAGTDNGVLILHSSGDRKIWIEVGRGLEGKLTDMTAGQIYRQEMVPRFKASDFAGGYNSAIDAINLAVKGEFQAKPGFEVSQPSTGGSGELDFPWWVWLIIIVVILLIVMAGASSSSGRGGYSSSSSSSWDSGSSSGGGYSGGGGGSDGGGAGGDY